MLKNPSARGENLRNRAKTWAGNGRGTGGNEGSRASLGPLGTALLRALIPGM